MPERRVENWEVEGVCQIVHMKPDCLTEDHLLPWGNEPNLHWKPSPGKKSHSVQYLEVTGDDEGCNVHKFCSRDLNWYNILTITYSIASQRAMVSHAPSIQKKQTYQPHSPPAYISNPEQSSCGASWKVGPQSEVSIQTEGSGPTSLPWTHVLGMICY